MKRALMILSVAIVFSCNSNSISDKDKELIKLNVALHNSTVGLDMKLRGYKADTTLVGYNPNGDPDLTYDKLIDFCKKKGHDPVLFAKTLTTK